MENNLILTLEEKNYKSFTAVSLYPIVSISFLGLFEEVFKIQKDLETPNQTYPHIKFSIKILYKVFVSFLT